MEKEIPKRIIYKECEIIGKKIKAQYDKTNRKSNINLDKLIGEETVEIKVEADKLGEDISVMSKVISPQGSTETLAFDSAIEILQTQNDAGRRSYISIPGNYIIGSKVGEADYTENSRVVIRC